jgi:hypothetical protein
MIVQMLKSHAKATMPSKGMWSKLMKLKNILTVAMYLHRKQLGASSSLICIERLQYHLPNQQMVLFDDDDDV